MDLDYRCHCGAQLKFSQDDKNWYCPNGHPVYACRNCEAVGRVSPLQWVTQYQRWYCYECKQYTPEAGLRGGSGETSKENAEEAEDQFEDDEEEYKEEEGSEDTGEYALGLARGSRVDEFCFMCNHLKFTQDNTHLLCELNIPRYLEPSIHDVTIRPIGAGKGVTGMCGQLSHLSADSVLNMQGWQEYFEKQTKRQIRSHEKVAMPVEMYRVDLFGSGTADGGGSAIHLPVNRDSLLGGNVAVIDKKNKKVWIHFPVEEPKILKGIAKVFGGIAGGMEDCYGSRYLQDLLKRDIESFEVEKAWLGKEPPEFWGVVDKNVSDLIVETPQQEGDQTAFEGPRIEMYKINYHTARSYGEYYTGGRSPSDTKSITLEPLNSSEEFNPKHMTIVVDHQTRTVWHWVGSKSARFTRFFIKHISSNATSRNLHLSVIGSKIGRNVENYNYVVIEENKEPEQFKRLFQ